VVANGRVRASVLRPGAEVDVGDDAIVAVRAAAVELGADGAGGGEVNSADCEIVFVEFLGDLVKLHLMAEGERMLAKVPGEEYAKLRGREGETITIRWKEEDVQLLRA
jgi:ABC-type Fe3+/spermidine/putrescine transport system ATPase subunit